ncbi:MAG: pectate lyase [Paludibacteraceae bacterium]|nr:pectate lyase [Paludibacteraceae bacterium]
MNVRAYILLLGCLPILAACRQGNTPEKPTIDSNTELVAACGHIEGGGAAVTGGDGGAIYRVSRLDDATDPNTGLPAAGTLRYAVNQAGARRVIFTVAGTIHLNSELRIRTGRLTIDGQSAPGDGICIADYPLVISGASNVIVRFIRVRLGDASNTEADAISVNDANGVVLDHVSSSWSVDECVSCYGNTNFTMQYCIISESLKESIHGKGNHGYGGIWGGTNASFHHNLLAHHDSRNPRFDHDYVNSVNAGPIDYVNNVVYNWGGNSAYGGEGSSNAAGGRHINFVANYYKPGQSTKSSVRERLLNPTTKCSNCTDKCGGSVAPGKFYLTGNYMAESNTVTIDNWKGVHPDESSKLAECKASTRWTDGLTALQNEQTAVAAYETVLAKAGCSLHRDAADTRIVNDVRNGTGTLINTQSEVGGWPELQSADTPLDTDYDGIPDEWETQFGLNPNDPIDAGAITLVSGYTNIEVYMRHLVRNLYD